MKTRFLILLIMLIALVGCDLPSPAGLTTPIPLPASATPAPTESPATTAPAEPIATAAELPTPAPTSSPLPTLLPTVGGAPPVYGYRVLQSYPHDPTAFTEGLVLEDGQLYEGTGLNGDSELRRVDLASGAVLQSREISPNEFGEGITLVGDRIIQLTWQNGIGHIYDRATFAPQGDFSYSGEGWGLTYDGTRLIMSDGTSNLRMLDPNSLAEIGKVEVTDSGAPITQINELEYVDGVVYANIWHSDRIARIDPTSGKVTAWLDLTGIAGADRPNNPEAVLNGIAFDTATGKLLVTGKLWPKMYEIEIVQ